MNKRGRYKGTPMQLECAPPGAYRKYLQRHLRGMLNSPAYKEAKSLDSVAEKPYRPVEEQPKSQLRKTPK